MSCNITLREVAEFQKGFAFKSKDYTSKGVKIIKVSNLTDDSVDISQCVCVENDIADKYKDKYNLKTNDIVITTVGSWPTNPASVVGKVIRVPKYADNTLLNQNTVRLRSNSLINQNYMYYLLKDKSFKEYIIGTAQGSANQASITQEDIKNFEFILPSLEEQEKIAKILSSLDDKIELNNEMNKTLEEMAQSIFKRWFVDFEFPNEDGQPYKSSGGEMVESKLGMIPKGWEVKKMKDISNLMMGISPKSSSYNNEFIGVPLLNGAGDFDNGNISPTKYTTEAKRVCSKGDIILSIRGTIGNLNISDSEYCLGRSMCALRGKDDIDNMLIFMNMSKSIELLKNNAIGSVIVGLSKPDIEEIMIAYPNYELRKLFSEQLYNLYFRKKHNISENENLKCIRDTLITRLMNGDISVV